MRIRDHVQDLVLRSRAEPKKGEKYGKVVMLMEN